MASASSYFLGGVLFVFAGVLVLFDFEPVWWSIATVVIVFTASAAFFVRALVEGQKSHNPDALSADPNLP